MVKLIEMKPPPLTSFEMVRTKDEGGMSLKEVDNEENVVLEGVVFSDGTVSIHWRSSLWSVTFFPDWRTFVQVHVGSHPTNGTVIRFYRKSESLFPKPSLEWKQEEELAVGADRC